MPQKHCCNDNKLGWVRTAFDGFAIDFQDHITSLQAIPRACAALQHAASLNARAVCVIKVSSAVYLRH